MPAIKNQIYTLEEYLELDHNSEEKIEFWDGHVFTLAGASEKHDRIQGNGYFALRSKLQGRNCRVFFSDMRVEVPAHPPYRYPDLSALCGDANFKMLGNQQLLTNPSLIIEVPSDSTAEFDGGYKFTYYKSIESFTEYISIAHDRAHITQFTKQNENGCLNREYNDIDDKFCLSSLDCEIELRELYENVEFSETDNRLGTASNPE